LERWYGLLWTGLLWLRIGTCERLLLMRQWTFRFHNMLGISRVAAQLAAFREGLSSIDLVRYKLQAPQHVIISAFCYFIALRINCESLPIGCRSIRHWTMFGYRLVPAVICRGAGHVTVHFKQFRYDKFRLTKIDSCKFIRIGIH
jgi:hypothetical protein